MEHAATTDPAPVPIRTVKITEDAVPAWHITETRQAAFPTVSKRKISKEGSGHEN